MSTEPDPSTGPSEDWDALVLDEDFVAGGVREAAAEERIARMRNIAHGNDRLRAAGEIADGSGKPRFHRVRRSIPWIVLGAVAGAVIVVVAIIAR